MATRCKRGHALDEDNVYVGPAGTINCRECTRMLQARRKDKRRTISVTGPTYRRFAIYCDQNNRSCSGMLEQMIRPLIAGIPDPGPGYQMATTPSEPGPRGPHSPTPDLDAIEYAFGPKFSGR